MENNIQTIGNKPVPCRGREFTGVVTSDKMANTVTVEWSRRRYVPKYQRYEKRKSKIKAHNSAQMHAKEGDTVRVRETRPISKTKNFIVVEVLAAAGDVIVKEDEQSKLDDKKVAKKKSAKKTAPKTKAAEETQEKDEE